MGKVYGLYDFEHRTKSRQTIPISHIQGYYVSRTYILSSIEYIFLGFGFGWGWGLRWILWFGAWNTTIPQKMPNFDFMLPQDKVQQQQQ